MHLRPQHVFALLLARSMSLAMAPHGVRVNAIGPGSIMTDVLAAVANDENGMRRILSRTPMMRIGDPLEVGQASLLHGLLRRWPTETAGWLPLHVRLTHAWRMVKLTTCDIEADTKWCRWRPSWHQMLPAT
jgi:Enoyl-(Acyl carrier protein) reductase